MEEGEEEEEGYLTGETDPFIMDSSEDAMVVCPVEERDREDFPPLEASVESPEVFIEDMLEVVLTDEREGAPASPTNVVDPRADFKGRLELYMLTVVFGDVGVVMVTEDLSGTAPAATEWSGEVREVYTEARFLIDAGSVAGLDGPPEDTKLAEPWTGY